MEQINERETVERQKRYSRETRERNRDEKDSRYDKREACDMREGQ